MRFFIALELDPSVKEHLAGLTSELRPQFKEVSWIESEQLFLINRFLGNPEKKARRQLNALIDEIGSQIAPFQASLGKVGCFPAQDPVRTLWIGVSESSGMLERFEWECETACKNAGLLNNEPRTDFVPHIVLGRISGKNPAGPLRRLFTQLRPEPLAIPCEHISLVLSKLTKAGPSYEVIHRAPFSARIAR